MPANRPLWGLLSRRSTLDNTATDLYGRLVAQARAPTFYADLGVPDTPEGRLELVLLHMMLVLRRLQREEAATAGHARALTETFVTRAIKASCVSLGCTPSFAMLAPERDADGRWSYTLFAQGELPPELPSRLDEALRANPHYALCRDLGQLGPLRCFPIASGAYEAFCAPFITAGQRLGDIKPRALSSRIGWETRFVRKV